MSNCEKFRHQLVGRLDHELTPQESAEVNEHLTRCFNCREELERLRETSGKLEGVHYAEPQDEVLRRLWRNPFSRLSRAGGMLLILLGYAVIIGYGLYSFFTGDKEALWGKLPVAAIVIGFIILFIHVVLERVKTCRKDPYREIER
jgi:hypothetical protein